MLFIYFFYLLPFQKQFLMKKSNPNYPKIVRTDSIDDIYSCVNHALNSSCVVVYKCSNRLPTGGCNRLANIYTRCSHTSSQAQSKTSSNKSTGRRAGKRPSSRQGHRPTSRQHSDSPKYLSDSEDIKDDFGSGLGVSDSKNKQTRTTSSASNKPEQKTKRFEGN